MKRIPRYLCVLFLAVVVARAQSAPSPAELAKLELAEGAMFDSFGAADVKTFEQLAGSDYFSINADGASVDRAGALAMLPKFKGSTSVRSEQQRRVYGATAILTGRAKFYVKGLLVAEVLYTEVWVWRDARWQFVNWQGTMTGLPSWYPVIVTSVLFLVLCGILRVVTRRKRRPLAA